MKKLALVLSLSMVLVGMAMAEVPTAFGPAPGGTSIGSGREVCWSEPPDPAGSIGSSEVIGAFALETEIANDFFFGGDSNVTMARWWGGFWNGDPINVNWNLRIYDDGGCVPGAVLAEWLNVPSNQTPVDTYYVWNYGITFAALGSTLYWFGAQAADHAFPPQCGRLATLLITQCDSVFKSVYFGYPDWTPAGDVFGYGYEASQEFECGGAVATDPTTWGAIKGLYR